MTGRMAMATIIYTCPISNLRKSALRSCAMRMGSVFLPLLLSTRAGVK